MALDWGGEGGHGGGGARDDETPDGSEEVVLVYNTTVAGVKIMIWTFQDYCKIRVHNTYKYYKAPGINQLIDGIDELKNLLGRL